MIIDKDLILLDLTGDKETIISTLANQAFEHGRLEDKQEYIEVIKNNTINILEKLLMKQLFMFN